VSPNQALHMTQPACRLFGVHRALIIIDTFHRI
jgi:hypothetical protein